jgi:hypothetical protein
VEIASIAKAKVKSHYGQQAVIPGMGFFQRMPDFPS